MPIKLGQPSASESKEARIEIIPLIDIMFFLLAAFMLVSLSMVHSKRANVDLPTATAATPESLKNFVNISVDREGLLFLDQKPMGRHELAAALTAMRKTNATARVLISGDQSARHGEIIGVLDLVRSTGIDKVAFEIRPSAGSGKP